MSSNFIYHNRLFHSVLLSSIYPIPYKISKKAPPRKWDCPIENCWYAIRAKMSDLSKVFEMNDICPFYQAISGI